MKLAPLALALPLLLAGSASAHADDGVYVAAAFSFSVPSVHPQAPMDHENVTGNRVRASLGYRRGNWAVEPTLALVSVDEHDYAMHQTTEIYDYALGGGQLKYLHQDGRGAWYLRAGAAHAWSQARVGRASQHGSGLDFGFGYQLGEKSGPTEGGFFADVGYEVTWIGPEDRDHDRINGMYLSLGFGAGTGY